MSTSSSSSVSASSSSSDSEKDTDTRKRNRKGELFESGDRVVGRKVEEKQVVVDEKKSREKKGSDLGRKEEKNEEKRPKREREETTGRRGDRYTERRFREVKERDSSRERREKVREKDIKERDPSRERRERESPRELKERDSYFSRSRRAPDRWRADDQDQERGYGRGRGRRFSAPGRHAWTGRHNGNDGRYNDSSSRQGWKDGDRDSYPRRRRNSFGEGEKWKHDMFESLVDEPDTAQPEEDPVAKIEALLAS